MVFRIFNNSIWIIDSLKSLHLRGWGFNTYCFHNFRVLWVYRNFFKLLTKTIFSCRLSNEHSYIPSSIQITLLNQFTLLNFYRSYFQARLSDTRFMITTWTQFKTWLLSAFLNILRKFAWPTYLLYDYFFLSRENFVISNENSIQAMDDRKVPPSYPWHKLWVHTLVASE